MAIYSNLPVQFVTILMGINFRMQHETPRTTFLLLSWWETFVSSRLSQHSGAMLQMFPANTWQNSQSYWQAISSQLFHLRGLHQESGWNSLHCGCCKPDPLHWWLPPEVCSSLLCVSSSHHANSNSGATCESRGFGQELSCGMLQVFWCKSLNTDYFTSLFCLKVCWLQCVAEQWRGGTRLLSTGQWCLMQRMQHEEDPGSDISIETILS